MNVHEKVVYTGTYKRRQCVDWAVAGTHFRGNGSWRKDSKEHSSLDADELLADKIVCSCHHGGYSIPLYFLPHYHLIFLFLCVPGTLSGMLDTEC